jgi:hypothetical protein
MRVFADKTWVSIPLEFVSVVADSCAWAYRHASTASMVAVLLTSLTLMMTTKSVAAQEDKLAARSLFDEGRRLMDAGQYDQACPKFEESIRVGGGSGAKYHLAQCYEAVGKTTSAWSLYLEIEAEASAGTDERDQQRAAAAAQQAAKLADTIPKLTIAVNTPVEGLVVTRDGVEVGAAAWGTPVAVDPGDHSITATAPGYVTWSATIKVPAQATPATTVDIPELMRKEAEPPTPAQQPPPTIRLTDTEQTTPPPEPESRGWIVALGADAAFVDGEDFYAGAGYRATAVTPAIGERLSLAFSPTLSDDRIGLSGNATLNVLGKASRSEFGPFVGVGWWLVPDGDYAEDSDFLDVEVGGRLLLGLGPLYGIAELAPTWVVAGPSTKAKLFLRSGLSLGVEL